MKYKVGDRVRIKSLDWYNENKDEDGNIRYKHGTVYPIFFTKYMSRFCGETVTIKCVHEKSYYMNETGSCEFWTDEMIEGLVEEGTNKLGTALNPIEPKSNANCLTQEMIEGLVEEENEKKLSDESWRYKNIFDYSQYPQSFECPEGYMFKDENGNVINATKIVLERKKKEYPKTYMECCDALSIPSYYKLRYCTYVHSYNEYTTSNKLCSLQDKLNILGKLIICRDAYWKIYGEEMGLNRPWGPIDSDYITERYCIFVHRGNIICSTPAEDCPLTFPTEEMRDAFYEYFKELIESCKELL